MSMKLPRYVLTVAVAVAGLLGSGAAQATLWTGDFNTGSSYDGVLTNIDGVDVYSQGSAAFFLGGTQLSPTGTSVAAGDIVTTYYQGIVNAFNSTSTPYPKLDFPTHPGTYQLTVAAMFQELVTFATPGLAVLQPLDGGQVGVFYDNNAATFANIALGTGYTDGTLIALGSISQASTLTNTFSTDGTQASGSATINGPLSFAQLGSTTPDVVGFLPDTPAGYTSTTTLQYGPDQGTTFQTSNFFDNNGIWTSVATLPANTIRADANVNFTVPEPATLALMGIGLLGLGFGQRRRRAAAA